MSCDMKGCSTPVEYENELCSSCEGAEFRGEQQEARLMEKEAQLNR